MHRSLRLVILIAICFAGMAGKQICIADSSGNAPGSGTPQKVQEAWLRFHESDLCQDVDAVFAFDKNGMEAWSRIESDRVSQKYQELFVSLGNDVQIALYTTRPATKKKSDDLDDPPPSLCQNQELRANLGDPVAQIKVKANPDDREIQPDILDISLKQRLLVYAERTLDGNKKMGKYAGDLPALVRFALDPATAPELKSRAMHACAGHARNLEKQIGKLAASLELAFPKLPRKDRHSSPPEDSGIASQNLSDGADRISAETQTVARHVYNFIHPEGFAVELSELSHPSLLGSLKKLRTMVSNFQTAIARNQ
jgi:hypothetical protein